jgi:hypothetical protein
MTSQVVVNYIYYTLLYNSSVTIPSYLCTMTDDPVSRRLPRVYEISPGEEGYAQYGLYVKVQCVEDEAVINFALEYYREKGRCIRVLMDEGGVFHRRFPLTPVLTARELLDELYLCAFCGREPPKDADGWMHVRKCWYCNKHMCENCSEGLFFHCPNCVHHLDDDD